MMAVNSINRQSGIRKCDEKPAARRPDLIVRTVPFRSPHCALEFRARLDYGDVLLMQCHLDTMRRAQMTERESIRSPLEDPLVPLDPLEHWRRHRGVN